MSNHFDQIYEYLYSETESGSTKWYWHPMEFWQTEVANVIFSLNKYNQMTIRKDKDLRVFTSYSTSLLELLKSTVGDYVESNDDYLLDIMSIGWISKDNGTTL